MQDYDKTYISSCLVTNLVYAGLNNLITPRAIDLLIEHQAAMENIYANLETAYQIPQPYPKESFYFPSEGTPVLVSDYLNSSPAIRCGELAGFEAKPSAFFMPTAGIFPEHRIDVRGLSLRDFDHYLVERAEVSRITTNLVADKFRCETHVYKADEDHVLIHDAERLGISQADFRRMWVQTRRREIADNYLQHMPIEDSAKDDQVVRLVNEDVARVFAQNVDYDRMVPPEMIFDGQGKPVLTVLKDCNAKVLGIGVYVIYKSADPEQDSELHWRGAFYDHEDPRTASMGIEHALVASALHTAYACNAVLYLTKAPKSVCDAWKTEVHQGYGLVRNAMPELSDTPYILAIQ
ncbi:hypothetical protein Peetri_00188 [Pseudomonas phage vB_PpuM-Peetri]